ncbi:ribonuclease E activity regulator RraA [Simiduia agarivorans]|uniref:4-hydroxy-4-methyl-2-oxoglutarate aldolase n=1 Tax=Simiduia agarivorans (strain DSM 21679 / JCM 13881 / BCRC 17597 / SA1) TaxID=1117647 RepID=K4KV79_SIMAS|nr:ribonuclease E activity regulator RraA [Simiduia agarivorans]AFU97852.1 ribonuclease activity regulator protein RraA [Simiduia agarivorans SA1 = DSM 21679]
MNPRQWSTPDIADQFPDAIRVLHPIFQCFGGHTAFCGEVITVRCFEDNSRVKALASEPGAGRVMVVDGAGSLRRALLGDQIAANALKNGWAGFVINGCVRDVEILKTLPLGVRALHACPVKTEKLDRGETNVTIAFAGVEFKSGQYLYADQSGILILEHAVEL